MSKLPLNCPMQARCDMKILYDRSQFPPEMLACVSRRENNSKRSFILVDKYQGKHFPISPDKPTELFRELAEETKRHVTESPENILFVGFAETATAVGAGVASHFHGSRYIHTTREPMDGCEFAAEFSEEHSHATEQALRCRDTKSLFSGISRVIFVEDEITTGKTIVNFINALKANPGIPDGITYSACSILNGMSEERTAELSALGYEFFHLMKIDMSDHIDSKIAESAEDIHERKSAPECSFYAVKGMIDPRLGVSADEYDTACASLAQQLARYLKISRRLDVSGMKIDVVGTEECMYPAVKTAELLRSLGADAYTHSTTRSPIEPHKKDGYPLSSRKRLASFYDESRVTYLYNSDKYDLVICITDSVKTDAFMQLTDFFPDTDRFVFVNWAAVMPSSYSQSDVTVLLKDITGKVEPLPAEERQKQIQRGVHYSAMLPIEYRPSEKYLAAYYAALDSCAEETAKAAVSLCAKIARQKGGNVALVSLARAGTPIGIILKRLLKQRFGIDAAHYTISIIRGIGIDKNAVRYILAQHSPRDIMFVDGWTGKGAILNTLTAAAAEFDGISDSLAVLADPANITDMCGTHRDILIPSSILNSTVSGLMSRTFLRDDIIGKNDFHGAAFHHGLVSEDLSYEYIERIMSAAENIPDGFEETETAVGTGIGEVKKIAADFGIDDINLVKPGLGEATRVLLRRVPHCLLIAEDIDDTRCISHLLRLAEEKNVPVRKYPLKRYRACGIIKTVADA